MPYTIRKAKEADYEAICRLEEELNSLHYKAIPETYRKPLRHAIRRGWFISSLEDKKDLYLIAEDKGTIIGFVSAEIEEEDQDRFSKKYRRLSIDEIYVSPDRQGQGIGTALLEKTEEWGKTKKTTHTVAVIYAFNEESLDFFKKRGYDPYSIRVRKMA